MRLKAATSVAAASTAIALTVFPSPARADDVRNDEWHLKTLRVSEAQRVSIGKGITVAVVDSGVYPHPDVRRNLVSGTSFVPGAPGNGQTDPRGHGTQMASLIAGHGHGQTGGVMGVASGAKILPVRVSDAQGRGDSDDVARGIEFAVEHGAEVVNFSGAVAPSQKLIAAVNAASASDVLVVAAAGNKGQDAINAYPAAVSGVLAVGASTRAGRAADFTFPNPNVQICAPGVDIIAADSRGGYVVGEGTSQATALVSGAAALVRAKFPELSAPEVIHRLTATATDIGAPGKDGKCGYGVLNVVKALTVDVPPLSGTTAGAPSTSASPTASPTPAAPEPSASAQTLPVVQRKGANVPAIAGGILAALALVGLLGFLVVRRRKATATQPSRPAP